MTWRDNWLLAVPPVLRIFPPLALAFVGGTALVWLQEHAHLGIGANLAPLVWCAAGAAVLVRPAQSLILAATALGVVALAASGAVDISVHRNWDAWRPADSLRVMGPNRVLWLNLTGSGNETAAHLLQNDRMTLMFCAFEGDPLILRLYGQARTIQPDHPQWSALLAHFPQLPGARQIYDLHVDLVQTSCGYGVPLFDYRQERPQMDAWAEAKGVEGIEAYWREKNQRSLDGLETGLFDFDAG